MRIIFDENLIERKIALVELPTNRWPVLQQIAPRILAAVERSEPASYTIIDL